MSNTPLEQNGADLASILTAINNLPEYSEVPLAVKVDLFSAVNAALIEETVDTINLADDTTFLSLESYASDVIIRAAVAASDNRKYFLDLDNYSYVATVEHYLVPTYTQMPSKSCSLGRAGIVAKFAYSGMPSFSGVELVRAKAKEWTNGYEIDDQYYGFKFSDNDFFSIADGYLYFIQPALYLRPNPSLASAESFQAMDAANTNFKVRQRLFRVPSEYFANKMQTVCYGMIQNASFEEDFVNGT